MNYPDSRCWSGQRDVAQRSGPGCFNDSIFEIICNARGGKHCTVGAKELGKPLFLHLSVCCSTLLVAVVRNTVEGVRTSGQRVD